MPVPVTSSSSPRPASPNATQKARSRTKRSRVTRRRARARGGIESDDEIERVLSTDSDSDSDVSLSSDSVTDSEQESEPEDEHPDRRIDTQTPNTSQSSGALEKVTVVDGKSNGALFSSSGNWSEMVADENANGAADLPVIEFSDFQEGAMSSSRAPPRRAKKAGKKVPVLPSSPSVPSPSSSWVGDDLGSRGVGADEDSQIDKDLSQRQLPPPRRPVGQSARQAYQQKLESDPSFVPKVGGFWGHDDRLMDKELRSLSGWWRGKWQGRGRGRGGFTLGHIRRGSHVGDDGKEEGMSLPPIERTWTHDGFEEMKRKEDKRVDIQRSVGPSLRGAARGRGGTITSRGGRGGPRGGFVNSGSRAAAAAKAGRVWYTMKPELMWTKQSENFLFFESSKHRVGAAYRIQLPGSRPQVIKASLPPAVTPNHVTVVTASVVGSDVGDAAFVIKLPKHIEESPVTVDETPLDDVFTVRPRLVNVEPIPLPAPSNTKSSPPADRPTHRSQSSSSAADPDPAIRTQLEQLSLEPSPTDPARWAQTEKAVLRKPTGEATTEEAPKSPSLESAVRRPSLPPIQTVYSPPPAQPSPAYPSSYGYPTLPPGIALNLHGVPYEVATGRPVYLPGPAPPPIYNSRPILHSHVPPHGVSYMSPPPHIHPSPAMSSDFSHRPPSHPHTPSVTGPVNGFIDPATGAPMFSLPRSSRVEIRAPGEDDSKGFVNGGIKPSSVTSPLAHGSSHLRVPPVPYTNSPSHSGTEYGYHSYSSSSDVSTLPSYASLPEAGASSDGQPNTTSQPMMPYPAYHQYYYPEVAYGYTQYVDMSQAGQYEMYTPMETHGTTYY